MSKMELSVDYNKQRKTILKGSLTRFANNVAKFSDGDNIQELKAKLLKQDREAKEFDRVITILIYATASPDEQDNLYTEMEEYNNSYTKARNNTMVLLGHAPEEPYIPTVTAHQSGPSGLNSGSSTAGTQQVRKHTQLMPVSLPKFDGKLSRWPEFADLFKSLVTDNETLSNIEKLMHLKSCLHAEAASVLDNITSRENNFQLAWDLLERQYNNPKLLIETHVKALFTLPKVCSDNTNSLREHLNKFNSNCRILKEAEGLTVDNLLIQLSLSKYDEITREKWEEYAYAIAEPTFEDVVNFLTQRSRIKTAAAKVPSLYTSQKRDFKPQSFVASTSNVIPSNRSNFKSSNTLKCNFCAEAHRIYECNSFLKLSAISRYESVQSKKLCINCLGNGHLIKQCNSKASCFKCHKRHNTLLHDAFPMTPINKTTHQSQQLMQTPSTSAQEHDSQTSEKITSRVMHSTVNTSSQILLSTVLIDVENAIGERYTCRALLDNGSQPHIATLNLLKRLGLTHTHCNTQLSGIGTAATTTMGYVTLRIFSKYNTYEAQIFTTVVDKIAQDIPSSKIDYSRLTLPENIQLADPTFHTPGPIDLIIGADLFFQILCARKLIDKNGPTLQETEFGWIISGRYPYAYSPQQTQTFHIRTIDLLDQQLQRFWEIENVSRSIDDLSENYCETHFLKTVSRDETGRFIVRLPFNSLKHELGTSYEMAAKRLIAIENRLERNSLLKIAYTDFMLEYEALGHMTKCKAPSKGYFIPHHAIIREHSLTTKCRCVFDASATTSTGVSLNDALHVGPVIQDDLMAILLRFRTHSVVFTADVQKMFRQINVANEDRNFQQILWRTAPAEPISVYRLNTVTYGTACAPYLSTRCFKELAIREMNNSPRAASVLMNDFYVDDCISGCASVTEASDIKRELITLLSAAGFPLQKWRSNRPELMSAGATSALVLDKSTMNTLGLSWNHNEDILTYLLTTATSQQSTMTKRSILSDVAKLFDPLGLVGPVVVVAKLLLQRLWKLKFSWDQVVPPETCAEWMDYRAQLGKIVTFAIPRCIFPSMYVYSELHGFSDASKVAYGCCVYVRTLDSQGVIATRLLCAKSRVAPVKTDTQCETTLPRLELCGALLLAELMNKVLRSIKMNFAKSFCWTDSTIVLCWLASAPHKYKTFVSNRVRSIQELISECEWRHVRTKQNPADLISRGVKPSDLKDNSLWWHGPQFLCDDESQWPQLTTIAHTYTSENRPVSLSSHIAIEHLNLTTRYSSLVKLVRVTAYCLRFANNCRARVRSGALSAQEYSDALNALIRLEQRNLFAREMTQLSRNEPLSPSSSIISLNPLLDDKQMLRVGGRLRHADIPFNQQHPLILPSHNSLTELIINYEHMRTLHAGQQSVLASLRTRYWPIAGKSTVRKVLRRCIRCCRVRPTLMQHIMGDLPHHRVTPSRPFTACGVDYCGPFTTVVSHRRGARSSKAYVAVFVCFATKATHLEVVGDLTTEACLNALRRFVSRRGIISHLYSDNGTNFVGCNNELKRLARCLSNEDVQDHLAMLQVTWHFIPPRSPHFGGLWEAAVKSAKHHLRRVAGQSTLTIEEFSTVLAQTEACLNSRPLIPISDDHNDLGALTPGHFLIGQPLTSLPDVDITEVPTNRLSRWQRVQQINQHFWTRWQKEYLSQLQTRTKWKQQHRPLQVGELVIVREENAPPLKWKLGRVLEVVLGADNVPRVAHVKTSVGTEIISVKRLCRLPIDSDK